MSVGATETGQVPPGGTSGADIHATDAWSITTGSSTVLIGVLDSGIPMLNGSLSHPDLNDQNKIIIGRDFVETLPADTTVEGLAKVAPTSARSLVRNQQ